MDNALSRYIAPSSEIDQDEWMTYVKSCDLGLTLEDGGIDGFKRWKQTHDAIHNSEYAKRYSAMVEASNKAWAEALKI